ncbi:hypothetical protein B0T13DRAFT_51279 [Neurospora crassa]|nr:hypothetical protein B0T13DRAFT_51279 [Neurospora crassa]
MREATNKSYCKAGRKTSRTWTNLGIRYPYSIHPRAPPSRPRVSRVHAGIFLAPLAPPAPAGLGGTRQVVPGCLVCDLSILPQLGGTGPKTSRLIVGEKATLSTIRACVLAKQTKRLAPSPPAFRIGAASRASGKSATVLHAVQGRRIAEEPLSTTCQAPGNQGHPTVVGGLPRLLPTHGSRLAVVCLLTVLTISSHLLHAFLHSLCRPAVLPGFPFPALVVACSRCDSALLKDMTWSRF